MKRLQPLSWTTTTQLGKTIQTKGMRPSVELPRPSKAVISKGNKTAKCRRTTATLRFRPAKTRCLHCYQSGAPCQSRSPELQPASPRTRRRLDRSPQSKVDGFCRSRCCLQSLITTREACTLGHKSRSRAFNVSVIVYSPNSTRVTPNGTLVPSWESLDFRVTLSS